MVLRGDWGLRLIAWLSLYPKMRPFVHGSHGSYGFFRFFMVVSMLIEPNLGPLQPLLHHPDLDQPNVIGSLTALGTVLLVFTSFNLNLSPVLRSARAGGRITAHPVNLLLAVLTLAAILVVIGAIIVDQYPCWMGVPNCD